MSDYNLPFYRNRYDDQYSKLLTIPQIIEKLKDSSLENRPKENLPLLRPSAIIPGKFSEKKPFSHTGVICVDIDNISSTKIQALKDCNQFLLVFTSPSGEGAKVFLTTNQILLPQNRYAHKRAYAVAKTHVERIAKIKADTTPAVEAPCFVGYDPEPAYNPNAPSIAYDEKEALNKEFIRLYKTDVDDYENWISQGIQLKGKFEDKGYQIWFLWSNSSEKFDIDILNEKWQSFETTLAKTEELRAQVKDIQAELTGDLLLEFFNKHGYSLRFNVRTEDIEISHDSENWAEKTTLSSSTLSLRQMKTKNTPLDSWVLLNPGVSATLKEEVRNFEIELPNREQSWWDFLIYVSHKNKVDTFAEWLKTLEWDGVHRLDNLLSLLSAKDPENLSDYNLNAIITKKIFLGALERTAFPGAVHDWMPVLIGEQGTGKSSFIKYLLPENRGWFSDSPSLKEPAEKQLEKIGSAVLIEYPEIAGSTRADINRIKAWISKPDDQVRKPYGRAPTRIRRSWVAIATANDDGSGVLPPDSTGNRRFVSIEVEGHPQPEKMIDKLIKIHPQLWAEALVMWQEVPHGFNILTKYEQELAESRNYLYTPRNEALYNIIREAHLNNEIEDFTAGDVAANLELVISPQEFATSYGIRNDFTRAVRALGYHTIINESGKAILKLSETYERPPEWDTPKHDT